jgi:Four helix bundle sensory module for signal transduction
MARGKLIWEKDLMESASHSNKGITSLQIGFAISLAFLLIFIVAFFMSHEHSNRLKTEFEKSTKKIQLVQIMKSDILASAEAEKSSVMADTDETSKAFAEQSMQASQNVEKARIEFESLIEKNGKEAKLQDDFNSCWEKLREADRESLSLAVQNTNLKAFRLSFGPAATGIRRMETALNQLMDSVVSYPNASRIERLASKALTGALNIYTLQAPHIAETTDTGMDGIEKKMKQFDEQVHDALSRLDALVIDSGKNLVGKAWKSYQDFQTINAEIIDLSRRNSNIRSFVLSLGKKRNTMVQCLDLLNALQDGVQKDATSIATK